MPTLNNISVAGRPALELDSAKGLKAVIVPGKGAVCSSLVFQHGDRELELFHRANELDENPLGGRNPVLFPVVGRSYADGEIGRYRHQGQLYEIDIHGFAKDHEWEIVQQSYDDQKASVTCEITPDASTRRAYPYDFQIQIEYTVQGTELTIRSMVKNTGAAPMPFSLGFHPYFKAPLMADVSNRSQCRICIPAKSHYEMKATVPTGNILPLDPALGAEQGYAVPDDGIEIIAGDLIADADGLVRCRLIDPMAGIEIVEIFDPTVYDTMTVYAPAGQPFVCLEPRTGIPMSLSDDSKCAYPNKIVPPGGTMELTATIAVRS